MAGAIVVALLSIYGLNRAVSAGKVIGSVQVDGVELGGLTPSETTLALSDHEALLADLPATFTVRAAPVSIQPISVGFGLDHDGLLAEAMAVGRQGNPFGQFWWWLTHLFSTSDIPAAGMVDGDALEAVLAVWDDQAVGNPPFPGGVDFDGTTPLPLYPNAGEQIDRDIAPELMLGEFLTEDRDRVTLPITTVEPPLTTADIDQAVAEARLILAGPVTLANTEREKQVTFTTEQIADALRTAVGNGGVVFTMDPEVVSSHLETVRAELEDAPVDARFEIDGNDVSVIPGRRGTLVDDVLAAEYLLRTAASASRRGLLPIEEAVDPEITTEALESLGIVHKVSQFTTYHDCCQNRVTNIHLIADAIDGVIVEAGQSLSLNDTVGERTTDAGYLEDGTIIGGEIVPTVGGGVSQFATTFYNALFWGGYEDVTHKAHSFYISRYPLGIEATISWPVPDLVFRNNTDKAILIKTSYSNTSITVIFFSDNDGRIVSGEQRGGRLRLATVAEGGASARIVSADVSDRFNPRSPPEPLYRGDAEVPPEAEVEAQSPADGFSVTVVRTIEFQGETTTQEWTVVYSPRRQIILVNPCTLEQNCPTTTVSTAATTTTTEETTTTTGGA